MYDDFQGTINSYRIIYSLPASCDLELKEVLSIMSTFVSVPT